MSNSESTESTEIVKRIEANVLSWLEERASKGDMPDATARNEGTALRQLAPYLELAPEADAQDLLAELDDAARRWANKNPGKSSVKTYLQRARQLVEDYACWKADPLAYKGRPVKQRKQRRRKVEAAAPAQVSIAVAEKRAATAVPKQSEAPRSEADPLRNYPIPGTDREFDFRVSGALRMADIPSILVHLSTMTADFDPGSVAKWLASMKDASHSTALVED